MSWKNPTKKEAEDAYSQAKSKYQNAAESYIHNKRELESIESERKSQLAKGYSTVKEKISFEKRIEQIEEVIRMLSPGGAADEAIRRANSSAKTAEEAFSKYLYCSGIKSPSISSAYKCPTVEEHPDSYDALQKIKKEKTRLEQAVRELQSKLKALEQETDALTKKINSLVSTQTDLSKIMKGCSYEMNHYKKYI